MAGYVFGSTCPMELWERSGDMMFRRFLIGFCIVLAAIGAIYVAAYAGLVYALTRADPYPSFMADYQPKAPRTYVQAEHAFSEFVGDTFPIGSDAKQAVALTTSQGFEMVSSTPVSFTLLWTRRAGPCSERYSIVIRQSESGSIVEATGQLNPVCL
jgi:hypothetical protein